MDFSHVNKSIIYNLQGVAQSAFPKFGSTNITEKFSSGSFMTNTVMFFNPTEGLTIYGLNSKVSRIADQNIGTLLNILA